MTADKKNQPRRHDAAIDEAEELPAPAHHGSAGGNMARKVGQRDELKSGAGADPLPTSVDGRDRPEDGDLPTRLQTRK